MCFKKEHCNVTVMSNFLTDDIYVKIWSVIGTSSKIRPNSEEINWKFIGTLQLVAHIQSNNQLTVFFFWVFFAMNPNARIRRIKRIPDMAKYHRAWKWKVAKLEHQPRTNWSYNLLLNSRANRCVIHAVSVPFSNHRQPPTAQTHTHQQREETRNKTGWGSRIGRDRWIPSNDPNVCVYIYTDVF